MSHAIEVVSLRKEWPVPGGGPPLVAVDDLSFTVDKGEVFGLLGPNGAGKSTTLRMLATLLRPTSGTARLAGHDAVQAPLEVRRHLGYLSATTGLPSRLRADECLMSFAVAHGLPDARRAVEESIERFAIGPFRERMTDALSTGMRQRLRIACAAVHRPAVLILDEPTSGLDIVAAEDLLRDVEALRDQGSAILFSTHIMTEARRLCDRIGILFEGQLRGVDTHEGLLTATQTSTLDEAFLRLARPRVGA